VVGQCLAAYSDYPALLLRNRYEENHEGSGNHEMVGTSGFRKGFCFSELRLAFSLHYSRAEAEMASKDWE
jgi:hypothetical protein